MVVTASLGLLQGAIPNPNPNPIPNPNPNPSPNLSEGLESACIAGSPPPLTQLPVDASHSEMCAWLPEPVRLANGLGMNVHRTVQQAGGASERQTKR